MGFISAVYFSNWSVYQANHYAQNLPADKLTHVFYAFMKIDPKSGAVSLSDPWADTQMPMTGGIKGSLDVLYALKKRHRNLKVLMSVGGWGTEGDFQQMMRSPETMMTFVTSAMKLVTTHKFDGVDIDWEYVRNDEEALKLAHLLGEIRAGLEDVTDNVLVTAAVPASQEHICALLLKLMDNYLNYFNVMCYDFTGEHWSSRTGYHSNLYGGNGANQLCVEQVISTYIKMGVPPHKLILGMPMYGRTFSRPSAPYPGTRFCKRPDSTNDIIEYRDINRRNEFYDKQRGAAYTYDSESRLLITYDNPACAAQKARYVISKGLGGGFFWDSKGDSELDSLLSAFVGEFHGQLEWEENWV